mmetsp:Transcript_44900/g.104922  ORF Transcript_44900/g.104922 Transcript_44900/m.104922 type:complete len:215 (-) Transcript_44900:716-1360(-)
MQRATIMIHVVPMFAAPMTKSTVSTTTPTSGKLTRETSSTKRAEYVDTVARIACARTFSRTLANMITVTQNIVTSIHSKEDVCFGIIEYAKVLKTCSERKEMNPVATRGITMSMGMKKPANGMKSRAVKGQKNRRMRMVIRRDTVTFTQMEVVALDRSTRVGSMEITEKPRFSNFATNLLDATRETGDAPSHLVANSSISIGLSGRGPSSESCT